MVLELENLLTDTDLQEILRQLDCATFVDGKQTAGWHARQVKQNTQLQKDDLSERLSRQIRVHLMNCPLFQAMTYPKSIHTIRICRYQAGMSYGSHVDNALMGGRFRADLSFTLFLNAPEAYDGGELCVELMDGDREFKLAAGSAIVYPSSTLHEVKEVRSGVRLVAVGWVESYIRDPARRELLFDLDTVKRSLFQKSGKTIEFDLLAKSHSNLLRQWAE